MTGFAMQIKRPLLGPVTLALLAAVIGLGSATAHSEERANCGYKGVEIAYTDRGDLRVACEALADVVGYFRRIGFRIAPKFFLTFEDYDDRESAHRLLTYGHFDPRASRIVVYRASSIQPWGLPWSKRLAASFLRHELVHMAVWQVIGHDSARLRPEWHEFIAYAVQLDLMDRELRDEVLAKVSNVSPVADLSQVNEFTSAMNPDAFAVAAYKTYRERGAEVFVRQLLRHEIVPPRLSFPFAVVPEREPAR